MEQIYKGKNISQEKKGRKEIVRPLRSLRICWIKMGLILHPSSNTEILNEWGGRLFSISPIWETVSKSSTINTNQKRRKKEL